ncbi:hypothetical protein ABO04_05075 [Nitrosomonas sp. HPC101]|uniref:DUF5906 domain-containing protein n=1 Tax=Nitrosomonas sp. HPC101 TaxID=1658667 RepID=UPI00136F867E|nr:DUF5906 domain-containing protein [Nitrosomonas sp. HPC101]MXS85307.1 hypothetical protein [Nitrosomonas sp. HPC101]
MNNKIDFKRIADAVLGRARALVPQWLPGGEMAGAEYKCLNPTRSDHRKGSFSINLVSGVWSDFATGDAGADLISLYAYIHHLSQLDAAKAVAEQLGITLDPSPGSVKEEKPPKNPARKRSAWVPVLPVPGDAPPVPVAHPVRGRSDRRWDYFDQDGRLLGAVHRFQTSDGGKEILPCVFAQHESSGKREWRWMAFPEPRPLYGLRELARYPEKPVLLVEGEKCTDAGRIVLEGDFVSISWSGGSKAVDKSDWQRLAGEVIYVWADCDAKRDKAGNLLPEHKQPGMAAMLRIRDILLNLDPATKFYIVPIPAPGEKPDGWDIADAIEEGMSKEALLSLIRSAAEVVDFTDEEKVSPPPSGEVNEKPDKPKQSAKKDKEKEIDWDKYAILKDHFALIYGTDTCYDLRHGMIVKVNHLRLAFGAGYVKMWLNSERRRMIMPDQLVFDPSCQTADSQINLFRGFEMRPRKGDCSVIIELLAHLCADSAESKQDVADVIDWVLKWLALPLQRPGTKMRSALVFHGPQGMGKNLFFEIFTRIYGHYALVVGQDQLEDKFNDWASQKLFLIGDEVVARQELYHHKNKLKAFITGETIQINAKMLPLRTEANHINVVFLSNEHQPLALEDGDRRYFVVYTPPGRDDVLYTRVAASFEKGSVEAFYRYLLDYDLDGYSEFSLPLMTTAKIDLIELGLKPADRFLREWLRGYLPLPLQVCSAGQLYRAFRHWCGLTGERFPPIQEHFSKSLIKSAALIGSRMPNKGPPLHYKVIKLDDSVSGKRAVRMWIPSDYHRPEGVTEGAWAANLMNIFEERLASFTGSKEGA